jgi:hypothetical protein
LGIETEVTTSFSAVFSLSENTRNLSGVSMTALTSPACRNCARRTFCNSSGKSAK